MRLPSEMEQKAWIDTESKKIYRVVSPPTAARVHFIREGRAIRAGDYGWGAPQQYPPKKVGRFVTSEGTDDHYGIVWLADFEAEELEFVTLKPTLTPLNPYAVQQS